MKVEIKNIKKSFDSQVVLDIPSMIFDKGLTSLMGRNGCGKTTLLNLLIGQMAYDDGKITYDNQTYNKHLATHITMVQQKPYLFRRSVYENIAYPLKVRGVPKHLVEPKVTRLLDLLDINDLTHKKGTDLSGGETQKVAIARALVFEPSLLMLDEPTSNIDAHSKEVIENAVLAHGAKGNTVIWVTHDQQQADKLGQAMIVLNP